jgi:prepilin-type N-terminal cleavage/methylation domain-containing protein
MRAAYQRGMTIIELVMVTVMIAILTAVAAVKYVDFTVPVSNVTLESSRLKVTLDWDKTVSDGRKTSPSNPWPTLQDLSGGQTGNTYTPAITSPGAPESVPAKIEYFWIFQGQANDWIGMFDTPLETWNPPMPRSQPYACSSGDLTGILRSGLDYGAGSQYYYTWLGWGNIKGTAVAEIRGEQVQTAGSGSRPTCRLFYSSVWNKTGGNWASPILSSTSYAGTYTAEPWTGAPLGDKFYLPSASRLNCKSGMLGVDGSATYTISGDGTGGSFNSNGMTIGKLHHWAMSAPAPTSGTFSNAVCVNQSGVIAPQNTPATQGSYPLATDFSGYCLATNRKLATFKDVAKTQPTTTWSDKVKALAPNVTEDSTHCPSSLF